MQFRSVSAEPLAATHGIPRFRGTPIEKHWIHDGLILRTSLQRKNVTAICRAIYRNELYTGPLNCGYFLEPVARN